MECHLNNSQRHLAEGRGRQLVFSFSREHDTEVGTRAGAENSHMTWEGDQIVELNVKIFLRMVRINGFM